MANKLGRPLPLTDEQIDILSQVNDVDIEKAKQLWRLAVSNEFKDLLDAQMLEDIENNNASG